MGGCRPEGHVAGPRNTRIGKTNSRQRGMKAPFEGGHGAEGTVAPHVDVWMV